MKIDTKIVSAFPGTGKTRFTGSDYAPANFALDSDSSRWSKNSAFPQDYIDHLKNNIGQYSFIFVSTHKAVRDGLTFRGIDYTLIYPDISLKPEYIERYKGRGSSEAFINMLSDYWDSWLTEIKNQKRCKHIVLQAGQYISNIQLNPPTP